MIKPYEIRICLADNILNLRDVVGHFIKEPYFVVEYADGSREMWNNDVIEFIAISKEWQNEDEIQE